MASGLVSKFVVLGIFSILITSGIVLATLQLSEAAPIIKTVHPKSVVGTFDTWQSCFDVPGAVGCSLSTGNKTADVNADDGDDSYILRISNSKWQTTVHESGTGGPDPVAGEIVSVTAFAIVRNDGVISGDVSVGCEVGKSNKKIFVSPSFTIQPGLLYERIDFTFLQNPATKPVRDWEIGDVDDWQFDGKTFACGILNQDRQNVAPIFATETGLEIAWIDNIPPVTTPSVPATSPGVWYTSGIPVTVSLSCFDPQPGSGCFSTSYSVNEGAFVTDPNDGTSPIGVDFSDEGVHSLSFFSTDVAGNDEDPPKDLVPDIMIDTLHPISSADLLPLNPTGSNGWYDSDVQVTISADDDTSLTTEVSGVASTSNSFNGVTLNPTIFSLTQADDGVHNITFDSIDVAGNLEPAGNSVSINMDQTSPTGSISIDEGSSGLGRDLNLTLNCNDDSANGFGGSGCFEMRLTTDGTLDTEAWVPVAGTAAIQVPAGHGDNTISVQYRDAAGNESAQEDASYELLADISITSTTCEAFEGGACSLGSVRWGIDEITVSGTITNPNPGLGDSVSVDTGAGTNEPGTITPVDDDSSTWSATFVYPSGSAPGSSYVAVAELSWNPSVFSGGSDPITVIKHDSTVILNTVNNVREGSEVIITGGLFSDESGLGVSGRQISFTHENQPPETLVPNGILPVSTGGVQVVGATSINNGILSIPVNGEILTPGQPNFILILTDQPSGSVTLDALIAGETFTVTEEVVQEIEDPLDKTFTLLTLSGGDTGITGIEVAAIVGAPDLSVLSIVTQNTERKTLSTADMSTVTSIEPILTFEGGSFVARVDSVGAEGAGPFEVVASFEGLLDDGSPDPDYNIAVTSPPDVDTQRYFVIRNTAGEGGAVNEIPFEGSLTQSLVCVNDQDFDGICDGSENKGGVAYYVFDGAYTKYRYPIPFINAGTILTSNIIYEIDTMGFPHSLRNNVIPTLQADFAAMTYAPTGTGFSSPILFDAWRDEITIPHVEVINIWADPDLPSKSDGIRGNDFVTIKQDFYGFSGVSLIDPTGPMEKVFLTPATPTVSYDSGTDEIVISTFDVTTPAVNWHKNTLANLCVSGAAVDCKTQGKIQIDVWVDTVDSGGSTVIDANLSLGAANDPSTGTIAISPIQINKNILSSLTTWKIHLDLPYLTTTDGTHTVNEIRIPVFFTAGSGNSISAIPSNNLVSSISSTVLDSKKLAVRYMMLGHSIGGAGGYAELFGNDIGLFMGDGFNTNRPTFIDGTPHTGTIGSRGEQVAIAFHEIGHNANLMHGGPAHEFDNAAVTFPDSDLNCKGNYLSSMSYERLIQSYTDNSFRTFSTGSVTTAIDEAALTEDNNVGYPVGETIFWGTPGLSPATQSVTIGALPFDINWDGLEFSPGVDITPAPGTVSVDANNMGYFGCLGNDHGVPYFDRNDIDNMDLRYAANPAGAYDAPIGDGSNDPDSSVTIGKYLKDNIFTGPVPPLALESERKAGTNAPIKVFAGYPTQDDDGNPIEGEIVGDEADGPIFADAYITISQVLPGDDRIEEENVRMAWDSATHFHFDWGTPKVPPKRLGEYNISVCLSLHTEIAVADPFPCHLMTTGLVDSESKPATMIITLVK